MADISLEEILFKSKHITHEQFIELGFHPAEKTKLLYEVFHENEKDQRNKNFQLADEIAAQKKIKIQGLEDGYTADDLAHWREEHGFSWDEQLGSGYHLVPSVIHDIVSHTGVVSVSKNAKKYLDELEQRKKTGDFTKYCIDESEAPINLQECAAYHYKVKTGKKVGTKKRGGIKMAKKLIKTRGANIERHHDIDTAKIKGNIDEDAKKKKEIEELGEDFIHDKAKLVAQIDKIENSNISASDKKAILEELKAAIEAVEEQYDEDVEKKYEEVQEDMEEQIETAEEGIEEMQEQADSMRQISMDASNTDATDAAKAAETKKREFERIKQDAVAELRAQIETANAQRRRVRANRRGNNS